MIATFKVIQKLRIFRSIPSVTKMMTKLNLIPILLSSSAQIIKMNYLLKKTRKKKFQMLLKIIEKKDLMKFDLSQRSLKLMQKANKTALIPKATMSHRVLQKNLLQKKVNKVNKAVTAFQEYWLLTTLTSILSQLGCLSKIITS
jgi:hypothetical protein